MALVFAVADFWKGDAFFTASQMGHGLVTAFGMQTLVSSVGGATLLYAALHVGAFVVFGIFAALVTRMARIEPTVLAGALLLFAVVEVAFYGALGMLQASTLTGALTWMQIAAGNVVGSVSIAALLWNGHPELRREIAVALDGME